MTDSDSDEFNRPSCSGNNGRGVGGRNRTRNNNDENQKRKRRIVMRIEFDDDDDTDDTSSIEATGGEDGDSQLVDLDVDARPSCSTRRLRSRAPTKTQKQQNQATNDDEDSNTLRRTLASRRLRNQHSRISSNDSDSEKDVGVSSGSEINECRKSRVKKPKKYVVSEDELDLQPSTSTKSKADDAGFSSDSSSNELLEKCPICLLTFRQQEIGTPATCEHIYCAGCIEAWSKNVQTCPIDRLEFDKIIVRESYENRRIVREINVNPNTTNKELRLDDDDVIYIGDEEDVTNCEICNSSEREDVMLLCDACNQGYHMDCLDPPLSVIPAGSWYCDNCFDSMDEDDEVDDAAEDLSMLYEDIRDMGLPETRLRVREVQQPRILRTRLNERLRAAIMRRTRSSTMAAAAAVAGVNTETTTTTRTTRQNGRSTDRTTTTTTTTTTRTTTRSTSKRGTRATTGRRRRRRARQRTYVVEYDLNNYDEKFAIKTTRKVIRRRRRKARSSRRTSAAASAAAANGVRLTASQRLAEQMGVKVDYNRSAFRKDGVPTLSLFGHANDLEYFSDSDGGLADDGISNQVQIDSGHGTAVQTSVRISSIGAPRSRKALLLGKLQRGSQQAATTVATNAGQVDILSSIMDMQDRWHNAARNMSQVHISQDGSLSLPPATPSTTNSGEQANQAPQSSTTTQHVTEAPMYPRGGGGGGSKFNSGRGGGGGSSGGNYNNRYGNNTSNYHGGGGGGGGGSGVGAGNPYQRHSTGGMMDNSNSGFGNHNFNNSANNNNNNGTGQQNIHFTPFNMRFNPRNQRLNQRQSLPFNARNEHQQQQQQQQLPNSQTTTPTNFSIPPPNVTDSNQLFGGLPAPTNQPPPSHIIANAPPIRAQPTVGVGVGVGVSPLVMPPILTVPPPPAPPPGIQPPWNSTLFKLTADYGNQGDDDDDDSNCPNFSVYSQESQAVAKSAESAQAESTAQAAKDDDDINEDLVQLDDDDDIPMPPDDKPQNDTTTTTTATATSRNTTDLYEPENPTDETEQHDKHIDLDTSETDSNDVKTSKKQNSSKNINNSKNRRGNDQYDPEEDTNSTFGEAASLADSVKTDKEDTRNEAGATAMKRPTPSPTLTESRLTESEPAVVDSRKGVLELYDDSDWEELDIDKPKEYEKAIEKADETVATTTPTTERSATAEDSQANGQDRSYTPCLDEKNDEEEVHLVDGEVVSQQSVDSTAVTPERLTTKDKTKGGDGKKSNEQPERVGDIETELISDEEDMTGNDEGKRRSRSKRRAGSKAKTRTSKHERNENVETFKKVSNKQKGRNYRIDKQLTPSRRRGSRAPRSLSRTPPLRSISRSRTRSKSKSRSRSRSPRRRRDGSRSPTRSRSRSQYSRSVSPRNRYRGRGGSAGGNFNKENNFRGGRGGGNFSGRGGSGGRYNQRNPRFNNFNQGYRQKRRELPRYDVRNVVGYPRGQQKDRYGRDTQRHLRSRSQSFNRRRAHSHSYSRSNSRSRPRSVSPKRGRGSFSMSPSPSSLHNRPFAGATQRAGRSSLSPRRYGAPRHVSHSPMPLARRITPLRERTQSPLRLGSRSRSRSIHSPQRLNGRKPAGVGKRTRGESPLFSPRYTPRLSHSRSRSRSKSPKKMKKKKKGDKKHKKKKQRATSGSPTRNRRISRQRDPFLDDDVDLLMPQRKKHRHSPKPGPSSAAVVAPAGVGIGGNMGRWSPSLSLSPPPHGNYVHELDKNTSWTPPLRSTVAAGLEDEFDLGMRRSISRLSKKEKRKRTKKKKKTTLEKREMRKEKRRKRRTKTPEPQPSKEVFASGNNILVSVSFNKDTTNASTSVANNAAQQQTTVVTLPPTREDLLVAGRRTSIDRLTNSSISKKTKKDKTRKRKKLEAKPVAIIDLERSPFQVHQEPADIIVLTDSEDANDNNSMVRRERNRRSASVSEHEHRERDEHHRMPLAGAHQHDKTPPAERMDTIMETSYESLPQTSSAMMTTGPKTPPEPPIVKFNLPAKKQHKLRNNPLHDDADDLASDNELGNVVVGRDTQRDESQPHETMNSQKIGPNTPPESGPCSPDAYDPFEPTKSPSLSPRSPTPPPLMDTVQNVHGDIGSIGGAGGSGGLGVGSSVGNTDGHETTSTAAQKHNQINEDATSNVNAGVGNTNNSCAGQTGTTLNPVDLVMALMNSKTNNASNDMTNKSTDTQYSNLHNSSNVNTTDDNMRDKADESNNAITVLSNVLLSNPTTSSQQHIPVISSPTPPSLAKKLAQLPKPGSGSVGSSSATNMPLSNANLRNGSGSGGMDDSFNLDIESPYSPGSADYEDLFEPPPDNPTTRRNKRGAKTEMFDNLFGSSSPIRMSNYGTAASKAKASKTNNKNERKSRIKVGKSDDHIKVYDDVPNSAVELQVKDKFLRKLNRQERVVEEVKLVLKPHFNKKIISKDDYKDIMRRAVPKICHSRSGEINPHKIKNLIDAYVKKFRAKHKKLNPLNTGQVSSAVKCAAYLKKL